MKRLISMLTMKRTSKPSFRDMVTWDEISFYRDKYGFEWMARYPYYPFKFRVRVTMLCKCGLPMGNGYSCLRTDCNQAIKFD